MIPTYPTARHTILCVDDDEVLLGYEKALLERSGYAVIAAASAEQGLRLATMCKCDAVLLDYEMLEMDGNNLLFGIRRVRPEVIIIMLSACDLSVYPPTLVDAFIPKLEASRTLLPTIAELCSRPRHHTRLQQRI